MAKAAAASSLCRWASFAFLLVSASLPVGTRPLTRLPFSLEDTHCVQLSTIGHWNGTSLAPRRPRSQPLYRILWWWMTCRNPPSSTHVTILINESLHSACWARSCAILKRRPSCGERKSNRRVTKVATKCQRERHPKVSHQQHATVWQKVPSPSATLTCSPRLFDHKII